MDEPLETEDRRRYVWPWIALGAVLLAVVLAVVWMTVAVERVRRSKVPETNLPVESGISNPPVSAANESNSVASPAP
jgi:hypothetical protein